MKHFITKLILIIPLQIVFSGCENNSIIFENAYDQYEGELSISGVSPQNYSYSGLIVSYPEKDSIECDAYMEIKGSVSSSIDNSIRALIIVRNNNTQEETKYWGDGTFEKQLWFRYGSGQYTVEVYKAIINADLDGLGVIKSYTYYAIPAYIFNVNNKRNEDGRYLYPSEVIQSSDLYIANLAQSIVIGKKSIDDAIKAIHDYTVQYLYYDFDSTIDGYRKKQDAISVLNAKAAVCEGYTNLFNALLRSIGIEAAYIYGDNHAWSYVGFEEGWKYVDVTWDDPIINGQLNNGNYISYEYYKLDKLDDHSIDGTDNSREIVNNIVAIRIK